MENQQFNMRSTRVDLTRIFSLSSAVTLIEIFIRLNIDKFIFNVIFVLITT